MKRVVFALGLAIIAAAAQAQTADDRVLHPSRANPSLVTALRNWLVSKTADSHAVAARGQSVAENRRKREEHQAQQEHREHLERRRDVRHDAHLRPDKAPLAEAPKPAEEPKSAAAPSLPEATAAPTAPTLASVNPDRPHTVATITVVAPGSSAARPHHGPSRCDSGERIITAYYWEGKYTASGARFEPDGYTAAHRTFPFGTKLLVTNPRNGKSVTVTVNDRGPFVKGVTLDLSRGAAKAIGLQGNAAVCMAKM